MVKKKFRLAQIEGTYLPTGEHEHTLVVLSGEFDTKEDAEDEIASRVSGAHWLMEHIILEVYSNE